MRKFIGYLYRHHLVRYLFVGGTTFLLDFGLLVLLHGIFKRNLEVSTTISYWVSIIYNFCLNRWWTFSASESKKLHEHLVLYAMLLGFNYLFTLLFVSFFSHYINYAVAKTLSVIIQVAWTYPIYKNVIFKKAPQNTT